MDLIWSQYALHEVWVSLASFGVLFFALWKFALPPITKMLDERSDKIRDSLEKAEETRMEAQTLLEEYKQQMAEARTEAGKLLDDARKAAEGMKDELTAQAASEAEEIKTKALEAIEAEKRAAMAELQASMASLSTDLAGRIIASELDEAKHKALIEGYLADVGSLDEG